MNYTIKQDESGKWTAYDENDCPMGDYKNASEMLKALSGTISSGASVEISVKECAS